MGVATPAAQVRNDGELFLHKLILSANQLRTHLLSNEFDAIILDLSLPGMDGIELCRKLRDEAAKSTPILMLTARDTLEDKIASLDAGADDYLVKPFETAELEARLRAIIRRASGQVVNETLEVTDLRIDTGTLEVIRAGQRLSLTPNRKQFCYWLLPLVLGLCGNRPW